MDDTPIEATRKFVHDIEWPASKAEVLAGMEKNGAPEDVLENLRTYHQERFVGPNAVHEALWSQA